MKQAPVRILFEADTKKVRDEMLRMLSGDPCEDPQAEPLGRSASARHKRTLGRRKARHRPVEVDERNPYQTADTSFEQQLAAAYRSGQS
jgi:hypothetical protein